jgi:hypothetical protein
MRCSTGSSSASAAGAAFDASGVVSMTRPYEVLVPRSGNAGCTPIEHVVNSLSTRVRRARSAGITANMK